MRAKDARVVDASTRQRRSIERHTLPQDRFQFVGQLADDRIRKKYLGRSVKSYFNNSRAAYVYAFPDGK
jgi:hypothetical protein